MHTNKYNLTVTVFVFISLHGKVSALSIVEYIFISFDLLSKNFVTKDPLPTLAHAFAAIQHRI